VPGQTGDGEMTEEIIDYARPLIRLERYLRMASDECLAKDYQAALDWLELIDAESETLRATLMIMKAQEEARK